MKVLVLLLSLLPVIQSSSSSSSRSRDGSQDKHQSHLLTAESVLSAPRPSSAVSSPDGNLAFISTSTYSFQSKKTTTDLYLLDLLSSSRSHSTTFDPTASSSTRPDPIISNLTNPIWFSKDEVAYLSTSEQDNGSVLYLKNVSTSQSQDPNDRGYRVGGFPTKIDNLKVVGASDKDRDDVNDQIYLLFTAEVYDDGKLENVREVENSEREQNWEKVKVYDSTMVRHWDKWLNPRKRSQLFSVKLRRDAKGYGVAWSFVSDFKNLLTSTKLEVPVAPFGTVADFSGNSKNGLAIFTTKDPEVNPAWHTRQNIYTVSLDGNDDGKGLKKISNGEYGATNSPIFSENGKWAFWLEMKRDGFEADKRYIKALDLENPDSESFYLAKNWDSSPTEIVFQNNESNEEESLLLISTDRGYEKVFEIKLNDHFKGATSSIKAQIQDGFFDDLKPIELLSEGSTSSLSPLKNGDLLATINTMQSPNDAFLVKKESERSEKVQLKRLTNFVKWSNLASVDFGDEPYQITYMGSGGRDAYGWILTPPGFNSSLSSNYPLSVIIHGGPESVFSSSWSTRWSAPLFAAHGFVVLLLNPAGSTGFGQEYQEEILKNWGHAPYLDVLSGVQYALDTIPSIDKERVVASGASFGGYMVNYLQGHNQNGLFKALVTHDGCFNLLNNWYTTEELWFPEFEFGGVPWENREEYQKFSPELHTANWETPHLIIHGGKDYRLTEGEGLAAFNTLQRRGVPSKLVYFPNENHWVLDPENSLTWNREVIGWLKKWSAPREKKQVEGELEMELELENKGKMRNGNGHGLVFQN